MTTPSPTPAPLSSTSGSSPLGRILALIGLIVSLGLVGSLLPTDSAAHAAPASERPVLAAVASPDVAVSSSFGLPRTASSSSWWGTTTWYSRSDVRQYGSWYGVVQLTALVCGAFSFLGPTAVKLCRSAVGGYAGWISGTFRDAKAANQCVEMKMTWTGQVIGMKRYACSWG